MRQHKRLLAVLFCDLVGSTELTYRLAAEDADKILSDYRTQVTGIIRDNGGHVARAMGDGILAYFGYPNASEDDAPRAVRAAMAIIEGLIDAASVEMRVRVGIALGEVVVTEAQSSADDTPSVVGHAANLAARLQSLAAPDTALVSEAVHAAAAQSFKFKDLGLKPIKGLPVEERVYLVISERKRRPRPIALAPMLGRDAELLVLVDQWEQAKRGRGVAMLLSGEPGIGKTRLVAGLEHIARSEGALVVRLQSASHRRNSDLHALHENLRSVAGVLPSDPMPIRRRKIERSFMLSGLPPPPDALLACLADIGDDRAQHEGAPGLPQQREGQASRLLEGLAELSRSVPILLVQEDAHWIDPTSADWLAHLVAGVRDTRMLIVVTARRDYEPSWIMHQDARLMIPRRLDDRVAEMIVRRLGGEANLTAEQRAEIVERAEGVPLYIEELTKDALHAQRHPTANAPLPLTLSAVLSSRLDAAGPAKRAAQMASALGRTFSHETAALVWGGAENGFERMLERLMAAEIILPRPIRPGSTYAFRHALLQEAAYASLLRDERVLIHARIVDVLRTSAPEEIDDRPEVVAYHCDGAEQYALAAQYWLAAGKAAAARGSVSVAVSCFKMGLSSLSNLARNPSLDRLKFELLLNLGPAAMAESGYAAQEGLETFQAAHALLHCSQNSQEELQVLIGLFNVHFGRGELKKALEVGTQTHQRLLVGFGGYPVLMGQAHCYMGNLGQARDCLEQAIAIYNPAVDGDLGLFCGANIVATSFLAKVEFAQGRLRRSAELTEEAMRLAEADGHPVGIAIAQLGRLFLLIEANDFAAGERVAEEAYKHASAHDLGNYKLWLQFFRAALSLQKDPAKALERMQAVLAALDKAGTLMFRPAQMAILAGGLAAVGRPGDAMAAIDAGLEVAERTEGREAIPALLRMRARMLLKADPVKARAALDLSLREARAQGALMEELRTATLVSRATKGTEAQQKGRTLLHNVLSRMPSDFPHPDLNFAARVLAELSE